MQHPVTAGVSDRVGTRLPVFLFFLLILAPSRAHSGSNVSWHGTTTQELPTISFKVERGTITELSLEWVLPLTEPCRVPTQTSSDSTAPRTRLDGNQTHYFHPYSRGHEPPKIAEKAWKATLDAGGPGQVELVVTGTFTSDTEASGTLEMTSKACQASTRVGWKTTREKKLPAQAGLDPGKAQSSDFNGSWAGTMGDVKPVISFTVANDRVTELTLEWVVPLTEPCSTYPGSAVAIARLGGRSSWHFFAGSPGNEPPRIAGKAWNATVDAGGPGQVKLVFAGRFTSESAAAGTLEFTAKACKGGARAAWKATKQK